MHDGPFLHVAFGHSAAKSLRDALRDLGRDEHVAIFPDDLGYGPINPPSIEARAEFWGEVMLFEDNPTIAEQTNAFWSDVATNVDNQVAWFSRLSVREYAAFHEYVSRRVSPPLFVDALYRCNTHGFDQVHDSFVWFRLRELMETDRLDSKGDTSSMWDSFVRARR